MVLEYFAPESVTEAVGLLARYGSDAKLIAGGQSLMVLLRQRVVRPSCLINLKAIRDREMMAIDKIDDRVLRIGALVTHREIEKSGLIRSELPVLSEMAGGIGCVQVRNWGTVGGSLAHADPSGDPGVLLLALGAVVRVAGSALRSRVVPLETFFRGYLETVLEPNEILTHVEVPLLKPRTGAAFLKEGVRRGDMAIASAAAVVGLDEGGKVIREAKVAVGGIADRPVRLYDLEEKLVGREAASWPDKGLSLGDVPLRSDPYFSSEYRLALAGVVVRRALGAAIQRARGEG